MIEATNMVVVKGFSRKDEMEWWVKGLRRKDEMEEVERLKEVLVNKNRERKRKVAESDKCATCCLIV